MEDSSRTYPTRDQVVQMVAEAMYSTRVLNNAHRGDAVEMMVLSALGEPWRFVGLGWHPWDLETGEGSDRIRIQVKQSAAVQLWGRTRSAIVSLGWKEKPPSYFERDNPGVAIEPEGWFCELFVVGVHSGIDPSTIDQLDPREWEFLVIPTCDLERGRKSISLAQARERWSPVSWLDLAEHVDRAIATVPLLV